MRLLSSFIGWGVWETRAMRNSVTKAITRSDKRAAESNIQIDDDNNNTINVPDNNTNTKHNDNDELPVTTDLNIPKLNDLRGISDWNAEIDQYRGERVVFEDLDLAQNNKS